MEWPVRVTSRRFNASITSPLRGGRVGVRVRRAEVWENLEEVSMRLEPIGRDLAVREHGEAVCDDVVGEQAAVRVPAGLGGVEAQHVGQNPLGIDQGSGFCAGIAPDVL